MQGIRRILGKSSRLPLKQTIMRGFASASSPVIQVVVNDKTGTATLSLNRPPANVLDLEMLVSLNEALKEIEQSKCRGLILTSTSNSVFCAGLDIKEMYKPDVERLREFWTAFQDSWLALYESTVPTAALINGHSPAGGCVFSSCCEYRVMLPNFTIGLNETQIGLVAPTFVRASFNIVLPQRIAEAALNQGRMFKSDEALQAGLVDELAANKEEGHEKCEKFLLNFAKIDPVARSMTKRQFRGEDLEDFRREKKQDLDDFVKLIMNEDMQQRLGLYLDKLQKKQNK